MSKKVEGTQIEQLTHGKESAEQRQLIKWWDNNCDVLFHIPLNSLLFHIANGGSRNYIEACQLKLQGVRRGIPDLFLAVPRGGKHGLFIEMKRADGGTLSDFQKQFIVQARKQGYEAWGVHGAALAKELIEKYLYEEDLEQDENELYYKGVEKCPF